MWALWRPPRYGPNGSFRACENLLLRTLPTHVRHMKPGSLLEVSEVRERAIHGGGSTCSFGGGEPDFAASQWALPNPFARSRFSTFAINSHCFPGDVIFFGEAGGKLSAGNQTDRRGFSRGVILIVFARRRREFHLVVGKPRVRPDAYATRLGAFCFLKRGEEFGRRRSGANIWKGQAAKRTWRTRRLVH